VYSQKGAAKDALIEVNKPVSMDGWKIYQLSYDTAMGKWSRYSVFELVKDPWLPAVYTGIAMLLAGALFLFISSPKKRI
jgi:cytochrome c biogenesis protein ResB